MVAFCEFLVCSEHQSNPRAYLACSGCTSESKDCYICSPVDNPARRPTQTVDRFAIWIYIYIHMYTPKLTSSHKWLCTNPFRKFVWKYKPPSWWTINFEPQKKPLRNFGEISCFSLPALVLKHYTYWCKSLVKTHLDRHCHRRILVDESPFTFGGSLASKHVQSYVCNKYLGDKGIGSPHSTWCLKQAETT